MRKDIAKFSFHKKQMEKSSFLESYHNSVITDSSKQVKFHFPCDKRWK